ncbi:inositol monophosphatase family protein [Actinokineospora globicatena]|uniref:Inositol-1-monophosphatase n=1 Tax=Actinokineospora globicatena TaxID=103729 RepID=A0A9W6QHI2_9PSEU|nr:inositol monophosphatase family protein [Actinokineospora globicatena]GLW89850.1 inositol monophosphatase [Actinokineospora globicatena]
MTDHRSLLKVAEDAVTLARDLIRSAGPLAVKDKGDRDRVTDLDIAVERAVRAYLHEQTPDIGFLGEEEGSTDVGRDMWILDPIDGTANLVHDVPLYAVSLALAVDERPVVAVIDLPALRMHYTATAGSGAYSTQGRMNASGATSLAGSFVSLGDYAVGAEGTKRDQLAITAALADRVERVRMFGSAAIDLAWVAEGRTDATVFLSNKPWDTAAGVLIAAEAGALVTDVAGQPHSLQSATTVAATPGIADELLHLLDVDQ